MIRKYRASLKFLAFFVLVAGGHSAQAASHLWRISEIYSSADGTIQFIELHECCNSPSEVFLFGKKMHSVQTNNLYSIPINLTGSTLNKYLLFATPAFAALPGAPTPDFIIPSNFFAQSGDTIEWEPNLNYDEFTFSAGQLPLNGPNSIHITDWVSHTFVTGAMTPTNFAGDTLDAPVPAASTWGLIATSLLIVTIGTVATLRKRRAEAI